jgi:hypothetical protein
MEEANSSVPDTSPRDLVTEILNYVREHGELEKWLRSAARFHSDASNPGALANDILYGAEEIAEFILGDRKFRRKVYSLIETSRLPHFRLGTTICSRKSVLLNWISEQEGEA